MSYTCGDPFKRTECLMLRKESKSFGDGKRNGRKAFLTRQRTNFRLVE